METHGEDGGKDQSGAAPSQEMLEATKAQGGRKESLPELSEGCGPDDTLISDFCPQELWEN